MKQRYFSTNEAAEILGLSPRFVQGLFDKRILTGSKDPISKTRRIERESIENFLSQNGFLEGILPLGGFVSTGKASALIDNRWPTNIIEGLLDRGDIIGYRVPGKKGDRRIYVPHFVAYIKSHPELNLAEVLKPDTLENLQYVVEGEWKRTAA